MVVVENHVPDVRRGVFAQQRPTGRSIRKPIAFFLEQSHCGECVEKRFRPSFVSTQLLRDCIDGQFVIPDQAENPKLDTGV
jgi:hypothetical protein